MSLPRNADDLKAWRARLGYTQVRAARILGIGRRTYQSYELSEKPVPWVLSLACHAIELDNEHVEQVAMTVEVSDEYYSLF